MKRFFHVRQPSLPSKGGATVCVSPATAKDGMPRVKVQIAVCSQQDAFWRQMGRLVAEKAKAPRTVELINLPVILQGVQDEVFSRAHVAHSKRVYTDYAYTMKYFEVDQQ